MLRKCKSKDYNWQFDTETGFFARWGKTQDIDPTYSPFGPEILDIEISTICHGVDDKVCSFCYKSNTPKGEYMTVAEFESILDKMKKNLTQVALGIGDVDYNPQVLEGILKSCRNRKIVPNITINGARLTDDLVAMLVKYCGAVSVSRYEDKNVCYNAIKRLKDAGMQQVNIHQLISMETYLAAWQTIMDCKEDARLAKLNSLIFLMLKPLGSRNVFRQVGNSDYLLLINFAILNKIKFGFDSCSAPTVLNILSKEHPELFSQTVNMIEPCEAALFSSYVNVKGEFLPCSFCEGKIKPIKLKKVVDFVTEVWYNKRTEQWREGLIKSNCGKCIAASDCRVCPLFQSVTLCK